MWEMLKKTLNILLWVALSGGIITLMGFAEVKRNHTLCRELNINVVRNDSSYFITPAEIRALIIKQQGEVTAKTFDKIDVRAMEQMLRSNPFVTDAQVFATLDGSLDITILQKKPVVRIISNGGESYYIDAAGSLMPLSDDFTALTMVVHGYINEPYERYSTMNIGKIERDTSLHSVLPSVYKLSRYIYNNPFWKAMIPEVYVDSARDFCLIPRIGNQHIIFGDTTNMQQKFNKLWVLYHDGLTAAGKWNDYSLINLKFNHQVICTKK